jgi:plasmid stabilization system protein ParE
LPRLIFSPRAAADLEAIGDYIAHDNPARAISFLEEPLFFLQSPASLNFELEFIAGMC